MTNKNFDHILSQQDLLKALANSKSSIRKAIIHKADKKLILAICESIFNLLSGNLAINNADFDKLTKYKHTFRKLIEKSNLKDKKKILVQQGGFLQYLIPAVITGLSSIISSAISNNKSE